MRISFIDTYGPIAGMIRKGTLWKYCAKFIPSVIPVGLCQEYTWSKDWIMVCSTACNLFLNNRKFSVKFFGLRPCPVLHQSFCGWPVVQTANPGSSRVGGVSPAPRQPGRERRQRFCLPAFPLPTRLCVFQWGHFPSLLRKFDLIFFQKLLKIANALSFSSYIIC